MMKVVWLLPCVILCTVGCFSEPGSSPSNNTSNNLTSNNTSTTNNGSTSGCVPEDETCDGLDNDCDGEVDEGFELGTACTAGVGACETGGTSVCTADGSATQCDATPSNPAAELCDDALDNDCDGDVDEGFDDLGGDCVNGLGECSTSGLVVCGPDRLSTICDAEPPMPAEPTEGTCDGLDNDCDGTTDEGCDDDSDGFCDAGFLVVSPGADPLCTNGGGDCDDDDDVVYPGAPGLCDGKDNDCLDGIDDIKRSVTHSFAVADYAATDLEHSPVLAVGTDTGFCFYMTGGTSGSRTITRGHFATAGESLVEGTTASPREEHVVDIVWTSAQCAALVIEEDGDATLDARLRRWTPLSASGGANLVVDDGIFHIAGSWDAALAFINGTYVVGYSSASGADASYVTLPSNFNSFTNASLANDVGLNGVFPELGLHPGANDLLFASNFFNVNVHQLQVGDLAAQVSAMTLTGSGSRAEMVINTVGGDTWFAIRNGGVVNAFEIRAISAVPGYTLLGEVGYASAPEPQDYIGRNLFAPGPQGTTWFIDPIDEEIAVIAADMMGGLSVTELTDTAGVGHMLAVRQASPDVSEILWQTSPGDATNDATFEVAEYTCH